jgi:FlaA1/EpsC-like NDP-sugar epimerase
MSPAYRRVFLTRAARLFDLAAVTLSFVAALAISTNSLSIPSFAEILLVRVKVLNFIVFGAYLGFCSVIFSACGLYLSHRLGTWTRLVREILLATTMIAASFIVLPLDLSFATKDFIVVYWALSFGVLLLSRIIGYAFLYHLRSQGRNLRNLVIVAEGAEATALADRIEKESTLGYRVLRVINTEGDLK